MNGCCYGRPANGPWAIHFPADHETHGAGVHPTQIYEATLNLAIYLALAWLSRRKKFEGQIFALYLVSYALMRAFVELFRGDYPPHYYLAGFITPAQLASGVFLAIGLGLLWQLPRAQGQRKSED
jgi:phosphatidylglycerol:prolipoprotein diacylglycerol transferase